MGLGGGGVREDGGRGNEVNCENLGGFWEQRFSMRH